MKIKIYLEEHDYIFLTIIALGLFFIALLVGGSGITLNIPHQTAWGFLIMTCSATLGFISLTKLHDWRQKNE